MSDVDRTPLSADGPSQQPSVKPTDVTRTRRGGTWRAVIAGFVSAIMLVAMLGVAVFAQTGKAAEGPTFLPESSVLYAELRLDLPGDQRDNLMAFLGHLPGFADSASFDTKLDETIDQMLGGSDSPISWTEDIKPWFGGQVMAGLAELPPMDASMTMSPEGAGDAAQSAPIIIGLSATDGAALDAAVAKLLGTMGDQVTTQEHDGTTISIVDNGGDQPTVLAPTDTVLLISNDVAQVETALDVLAGTTPSLAADADYQAAVATLPADRVGAFYVDTAQLKDSLLPLLEQQLAAQPETAASADQVAAALEMLPPWLTGLIRVESDHLTFSIDAPVVAGGPTVSVRSTDLATKMPADTLLYLETRDLGAGIRTIFEQLKPMLEAQGNDQALAQIEALLGTGLEDYLSWVEDVAIGASLGTTGPSVGIVATVTDEETAQKRIDSLLSLIRMISATADPSPVELTTEEVDGTTVTTIALTDAAGSSAMGLPIEPKLSIAIGDGHLYLGLGDFAKDAVARDPADSLAATPGYTKALTAAGEANGGLVYVDVASALGLAEMVMSGSDREMFEAQIKPYADALDFVVAAIGQSETTSSASLMLFVK
jgi:hypothetical protein